MLGVAIFKENQPHGHKTQPHGFLHGYDNGFGILWMEGLFFVVSFGYERHNLGSDAKNDVKPTD